jgi:outer membrane immunogenic protein
MRLRRSASASSPSSLIPNADWHAHGVPDRAHPTRKIGRGRASALARRLVATMALTALMVGSASAADVPVTVVAPAQSCPAAWWRGWYAGLNFGGVAYTAQRTDQDGQLGNVATYTQKQSGFLGGGQIGYNGTICNALLGIEVDGSAGSVVAATTLLPNVPDTDISITSHFNALVTARTRAGIVVDSLLLYVTGGLAAVHTSTTYHNFNIASDVFTFDNWRWGWVAGFGAEWACSERVSLRSEALYVDAADRTFTFVSPTLGPGNFTHGDSMWIARVGINVKLGDDSVVASQ